MSSPAATPARPGNPFARQSAALRQAALDAVSAADITAVTRALIEKASQGNVQAAKLLLSYSLGKPTAAPDPDRLDAAEWQGFKDTANLMRELPHVSSAPAPDLPLSIVRTARPGLAAGMGQKLGTMLKEEPQPLPDLEMVDDTAPPLSPNGHCHERRWTETRRGGDKERGRGGDRQTTTLH